MFGRILDFFNACDEVWIPQAYVEDTVREYGYKGKLTVVENGNDFASIISGDVRTYKDQARERLGIKDDEIGFLFVGWKRLSTLWGGSRQLTNACFHPSPCSCLLLPLYLSARWSFEIVSQVATADLNS